MSDPELSRERWLAREAAQRIAEGEEPGDIEPEALSALFDWIQPIIQLRALDQYIDNLPF